MECPTCQKPLTVDIEECIKTEETCDIEYTKNSILSCIKLDKFQSSTKIDALVCSFHIHPYVFEPNFEYVKTGTWLCALQHKAMGHGILNSCPFG